MLARAIGLDQAQVEIEFALHDRRAIVDRDRERIAGGLRMLHQRAQDGRCREAAEGADKGPVVRAGASLPATIAGRDPRGVVEEVGDLVSIVRLLTPSFRSDAKHRTRNLEIPGLVLAHHPGRTESISRSPHQIQ
jgi:hypothetical protein